MTDRIHAVQVGAPDPELRNSPIIEETDEDYETAAQTLSDEPLCYFNGNAYQDDQFVCSGSELLHCTRGVWLQQGSCDPDNP
jgi:hypothetical protein